MALRSRAFYWSLAASVLVLTGAMPAGANTLRDSYSQRKAEEAQRDSCDHWYAGQWINEDALSGGSSLLQFTLNSEGYELISGARLRQLPNGDLFASTLDVDAFLRRGKPPVIKGCKGNYTNKKIGYTKKFYKDGSGYERDIVIEDGKLVQYESSCWKWECRRVYTRRQVLASPLDPEVKARENASIRRGELPKKIEDSQPLNPIESSMPGFELPPLISPER